MPNSTENNSLDNISTPIDNYFYRLEGQTPVRCTLAEYAQNMLSETNRIIAQHTLDKYLLSTAFTGIDQAFGLGEPRLFETILFGVEDDIHPKWQYASWDEAFEHHHQLLQMIETNGIEALVQQIREKTAQ